ncbi:hypothetical protein [Pelagibacterium mangrovi]|uniref:hypothetical protein n=1 Tax=Pelagibacterium mangrovi TaxID=3119828 RepID=UPI002FC64428
MRIVFVAACLVLPTGIASAQTLEPDFRQFFRDSQLALQKMSEPQVPDTTSGPPLFPLPEGLTLQLSQSGANAVNILNSDRDLGSVTQLFDGQQGIENSIDAHRSGTLGSLSISQSGSNYANMMQGNTISMADQLMTDTSTQQVWNSIWAGGSIDVIAQTGVNIANIAMAEYAIGTAVQNIEEGAIQRVENYIEFDADTAVSGTVNQSGVNIGNVLIADRIDSVTRTFAGEQIVDNTVVLHGSSVPPIEQSGGNIANMVVANNIGTIKQLSVGAQRVINTVIGPDGQPLSHGNISQSDYNYQGASNVVNMMVLRAQQSGSSSPQQPVLIDQQANFPQTGQGVSGQSQSGNVTVINR